MTNRLRLSVPLFAVFLLSSCIDVPDVAEPEEVPDAGQPATDAGNLPDAGGTPDSGPADTVSPTLRSSTPLGGATQVPTSTGLVLTFSESMSTGSVQVSVEPAASFVNPAWSLQNTTLTLETASALRQNTVYTVTVDGQDLAGNPLSGGRAFSFTTTGPAPDTAAPTVLATTPSNEALGVARNTLIEVVFSEPMNRASVEAAFVVLAPAGLNQGTIAWNSASTVLTYTLSTSLAYGTNVQWQLSTGAKDVAGNALTEIIARNFRAVRQGTMTFDFDPMTTGELSGPTPWRQTATYNYASVGDWFGNAPTRLFLGFQMSTLPENLITIQQARLKWWTNGQAGEPFKNLGQLLLEPVNYGETIPVSFENDPTLIPILYTQPTGSAMVIPETGIGKPGIIDVTTMVAADWTHRELRNKRSQYRLRFTAETNFNDTTDALYSEAETHPKLAELEVVYEHP
ncbi:Ig-like domain-containing protein [Myxococcus fulvus]|uniref:Ig-like domain-containing protein n=1 Tax=Myxococcus fulvus TaxID=33 RepID=UPI003B9CB72E